MRVRVEVLPEVESCGDDDSNLAVRQSVLHYCCPTTTDSFNLLYTVATYEPQ